MVLADAGGPPSFSTVTSHGCTSEPCQRRSQTKERLCADWIRLEPNSVSVNKPASPNTPLQPHSSPRGEPHTYVRAATHAGNLKAGKQTPTRIRQPHCCLQRAFPSGAEKHMNSWKYGKVTSCRFYNQMHDILNHPECYFLILFMMLESPDPPGLLSRPFELLQHQRVPVAPVGWPLASHFLPCSPAFQWWRALSGLSRPQGVYQKPPQGAHRRFLLI